MALTSDDKTLYIGNLDKNVSEGVLYELFLQAGPIERVNIVNNTMDSFRYGFVTYKHEISIDYAIQLYKGTYLFNKEIFIKKKGKTTNNGPQSNEYGKHGAIDTVEDPNRRNSTFRQFSQEQLHNGFQSFRQNNNNNWDSQMVFTFKADSLEGNWHKKNKPYSRSSRMYSSRPPEPRRRHKTRNEGNKPYHNRNKRY